MYIYAYIYIYAHITYATANPHQFPSWTVQLAAATQWAVGSIWPSISVSLVGFAGVLGERRFWDSSEVLGSMRSMRSMRVGFFGGWKRVWDVDGLFIFLYYWEHVAKISIPWPRPWGGHSMPLPHACVSAQAYLRGLLMHVCLLRYQLYGSPMSMWHPTNGFNFNWLFILLHKTLLFDKLTVTVTVTVYLF